MFGWKKLAAFAGGVLFGTAGISILKSGCQEGIHPLHSGHSAWQRCGHEDRDFSSGELQ